MPITHPALNGNGDSGASRIAHAGSPITGSELCRADWVFAITVQNGKVTKIREYIDTQALARASHPARSSNAQP